MKRLFKQIALVVFGAALIFSCSSAPSDPESLADYALEKFKADDMEALIECSTEENALKLKAELENNELLEKEAETNENIRKALEFGKDFKKKISEAQFEKGEIEDVSEGIKEVVYRSENGKLRVILKEVNGEWKLDMIGM